MAFPSSHVLSIFDPVCTVLPLKNISVSFLFVDILIWKYIILIYSALVRWYWGNGMHYSDAMISAIASQIVGVSIVCSTVGQAQLKENIEAPRHWLLWGKNHRLQVSSPHKKACNVENISIWWRHHDFPFTMNWHRCHDKFPPSIKLIILDEKLFR